MSKYLVLLRKDAGSPNVESKTNSLVSEFDIEIESSYNSFVRGFSGTIPEDRVKELSIHPSVDKIIKDVKIAFIPSLFKKGSAPAKNTIPRFVSWGIQDINAPVVSKHNILKNIEIDTDIYIIDSGVDAKHPNLNVVESISMVKKLFSSDRVIHGHGTHVAGIIGARDMDNGVVGVAPGSRIHSVRVLDENGEGMLSWMFAGLDFINKRANETTLPLLVNLSLGFDTETAEYTYLDKAISHVAEKGVIFVAAAGNSGRDAATTSPAHCLNVISVGSYNLNREYSEFSNYGLNVNIFAPGEEILSTWPGGTYAMLSGTSMAAPHITGVVALYLSNYSKRLVTIEEVRKWLKTAENKSKIKDLPSENTTSFSVYLPPTVAFKGHFNLACTIEYPKSGTKKTKYFQSKIEFKEKFISH